MRTQNTRTPLNLDADSFHSRALGLVMRWSLYCQENPVDTRELPLMERASKIDVSTFYLGMTTALLHVMQFSMAMVALERGETGIEIRDLWGKNDPEVPENRTFVYKVMAEARLHLGDQDAVFFEEVNGLLDDAETRLHQIRNDYERTLAAAQIVAQHMGRNRTGKGLAARP